MTSLTEPQLRLAIAFVSFLVGFYVGYLVWHRNGDKKLTSLQIASVGLFFGYLGFTYLVGREPSDFVSTAILALTGGELVGKVISDRFKK